MDQQTATKKSAKRRSAESAAEPPASKLPVIPEEFYDDFTQAICEEDFAPTQEVLAAEEEKKEPSVKPLMTLTCFVFEEYKLMETQYGKFYNCGSGTGDFDSTLGYDKETKTNNQRFDVWMMKPANVSRTMEFSPGTKLKISSKEIKQVKANFTISNIHPETLKTKKPFGEGYKVTYGRIYDAKKKTQRVLNMYSEGFAVNHDYRIEYKNTGFTANNGSIIYSVKIYDD